MIKHFNITLRSLENEDMEGLTVEIKLFDGDRELEIGFVFFGPGVIGHTAETGGFDGLLGAGEVREHRGMVMISMDELPNDFAVNDGETVAKVMLGDVVFDELTVVS